MLWAMNRVKNFLPAEGLAGWPRTSQVWRASLESPQSGEKLGFPDLRHSSPFCAA